MYLAKLRRGNVAIRVIQKFIQRGQEILYVQ